MSRFGLERSEIAGFAAVLVVAIALSIASIAEGISPRAIALAVGIMVMATGVSFLLLRAIRRRSSR